MASLAPANATVLNLVPSSCAQACQITSSSFESCEYGICICTEDNAIALEDCVSCLYALSPIQGIYDAAQGIFAGFQETCSPALNFSLQIIPDSSSTALSSSSSSTTTSSSADIGTVTVSSTLPASTSQTTFLSLPSQTAQWSVNDGQVCRAVYRKAVGPLNSTKAKANAGLKASNPGRKFTQVAVIVVLALTIRVY